MKPLTGVADALNRNLRRLDHTLGIDHAGRSEWIWAIPAFSFFATLGIVLYMGVVTEMGLAVAIPVGLIGALFMGGLSIAYMTPVDVDEGRGGDQGPGQDKPPHEPQPPSSDGPPLWWVNLPADPSAPDAEQEHEREPAGSRR